MIGSPDLINKEAKSGMEGCIASPRFQLDNMNTGLMNLDKFFGRCASELKKQEELWLITG